MGRRTRRPSGEVGRRRGPVVADLAVVVAFAAAGRASHAEGLSPVGVLATAAPFAVAALAARLLPLVRRDPVGLASGGVVAASAVTGGLALRAATGGGTAPAFVVVAAAVLGAGLLGWRLAVARRRRAARPAHPRDSSSSAPPWRGPRAGAGHPGTP